MELLVAMTIFGIVVAVVYGTMRVGVDTWRSAEASADLQREMRVAYRLFSRDIRDVYTSAYDQKISFVGWTDHLTFYRRGGPAGLEQVAYGVDTSAGFLLRGQRSNIRTEDEPFGEGWQNSPTAVGGVNQGAGGAAGQESSFRIQHLVERITRLQFRYYDAKRAYWLGEWDSTREEGRLPAAVEVTLWVAAGRKSFQELFGSGESRGSWGRTIQSGSPGLRFPPFVAPVYSARQLPGDEW